MNRVLVTGGTGYIGSVLVRELLDRSDVETVRVADISLETVPSSESSKTLEFAKCDIRKNNELEMALKDVDTVFHLAAIVGDSVCDMMPTMTREVNVEAVKKLIEAALKNGVEKIIFSSTCSVYGLQPNDLDVYEHTEPSPTSLYGVTKLEAERLFQKAHRETGFDIRILRLATVYGPSPSMHFNIFPNLFVLNACTKKAIRIYGADAWRPLLYTKDAARAFVMAGERTSQGFSGETFNVGDNNENYRIRQVAQIVAEEIPGTKIVEESKAADPRSYKVNFDKVQDALGFKPEYRFRKGVQELRDLINSGAIMTRKVKS